MPRETVGRAPRDPEADSVCGFFSTSIVERYLGIEGPDGFTSDGSGMVSKKARQTDTADCVVNSTQTGTARLSAVIVEYGDHHSRSSAERQIDQETAKDERCNKQQWAELGEGTVCLLDVSTQVAVATDQRLIRIGRVTEGGRPPASAATALTFARQADEAADSFVESDSNRADESTP